MVIMAMDMLNKLNVALILLLSLLSVSHAGEWEFSPNVSLDETYSDNVELDSTNEISSLVTQSVIGIDSKYKSKKVAFNFKSSSRYVLYSHDHNSDGDYHTFSSDAKIALWPNGLIFNAQASLQNQPKNSSNNALADIISADTVRVSTYRTGLAYKTSNRDFSLNSQINYSTTEAEDDIGERDGINFTFNSRNGTAAKNIFWDFTSRYRKQENNNDSDAIQKNTELKLGWITGYKFLPFIRYYNEDNSGSISGGRDIKSSSYGLGLRWFASQRLYIDLSYNDPIDDKSPSLSGSQLDPYLDFSINWQPTVRTQLQYNRTQRFFGNSTTLSISHRNKRLTNSISYTEQVETFTRQNIIFNLFCPDGDDSNTDLCLEDISDLPSPSPINYTNINLDEPILIEDESYSLNKILAWTSILELPRTTFTFNINKRDTNFLSSNNLQDGGQVSLKVGRRISNNSSLSMQAQYTESSYNRSPELDVSDIYRRYTVEYSKSLNNQLTLNLGLSNTDRTSQQDNFNYQENRVYLKVNKGF
jgi:uncharacterized protein (PEP-CTERM system associated)